MALNIKNERVHQLALEAARVTGKTQTGAIEEALERLLREYDADPEEAGVGRTLSLVRGIAAEYGQQPGRDELVLTHVDDLYDDRTGLPR